MRRILALAILGVLWATSAPVWAQDANLKAALYDIERAEGQIGSLTPSRKANIVRLQRSLGATEQRLQAAPDKSTPGLAGCERTAGEAEGGVGRAGVGRGSGGGCSRAAKSSANAASGSCACRQGCRQ